MHGNTSFHCMTFHCKAFARKRSSSTPKTMALGWAVLVLLLSTPTKADGDTYPPAGGMTQKPQQEEAKTITLERLFHPNEKFDFDGQLPSTHWIQSGGSGSKISAAVAPGPPTISEEAFESKLLIRDGDEWKQYVIGTDATPTPHSETPNDSRNGNQNDDHPESAEGTKGEAANDEPSDRIPWPTFQRLCKHLQSLDDVDGDAATRSIVRTIQQMQHESDTLLVKVGRLLATVSVDDGAHVLARDASTWKHVKLDPTDRRVAYTIDGDLYVTDAKSLLTRRLTNDGLETLLDGELDWTYQEEIFGRGNYRGFWFSPDGNWLAMMRVDTSQIEPYVLSAAVDDRGEGPVVRYSKSGDPIPHASLHVWDLRRFDLETPPKPTQLVQSNLEDEKIITGVWWHPHDGSLIYSFSDRVQSYRELHKVDPSLLSEGASASRLLLREQSPAWVEPPSSPAWLKDGGLLWRSELPSGYYRVYRLSGDGSSIIPVTPTGMNVRQFSLSPSQDRIWIVGDAGDGEHPAGTEQQLYELELDRPASTFRGLTKKPGWHTTDISPDGQWFTDRFSTPSVPEILTVQKIAKETIEPSAELESSVIAATKLLTAKPIRRPKLFSITTDDGTKLPAMLVKPDLSMESNSKHPVVIEVYGGPENPVVTSRFGGRSALYRELLARQGIATLVVDNRSSAGNSNLATWSIHRQMGEVEFKDVLSAVDWLKSEDWVDADRLAIGGWSFGGFLTLYCLTHSDAFAAGVAGGSVTDWHEYDSFYTERYMGLPSENVDGYARTSLITAAKNLNGRLLMIHGEVDDNVHPANTLRMAAALQKAGKPFQLMIYPGAAHSVTQAKQAWHLAEMRHRFLLDALTQ